MTWACPGIVSETWLSRSASSICAYHRRCPNRAAAFFPRRASRPQAISTGRRSRPRRNARARAEVESLVMHNEFTAIIEQDGDWFIAYSPEIPGANGQGRSANEARANLGEAISLILEDRREDALRGVPSNAIRETVVVE